VEEDSILCSSLYESLISLSSQEVLPGREYDGASQQVAGPSQQMAEPSQKGAVPSQQCSSDEDTTI